MRAAVLTEIDKPLEAFQLDVPSIDTGQIIVDIKVSGVCGSSLLDIGGFKGNKKFLPHMMGHEGGGIVNSIGPGVTKVKPGDRVVMHWRKGSGIEAPFVKYGKVGAGKVTTFSEQAVVSENRVTKVPDNTPLDLCALLGCGLTTAFGAVCNVAKVSMGESVLVLGCGGVGLSLIKGASISGAAPITAYDITDKCDITFNHGADNFYHDWNLINDKFDVILDSVGNQQLFEQAVDKLAENGRYVVVGWHWATKQNRSMTMPDMMNMFEGDGKTILTTNGGHTCPDVDIPRYVKLYQKGLIDLDALITHRYTLHDINKAIDALRGGIPGRIMIDI